MQLQYLKKDLRIWLSHAHFIAEIRTIKKTLEIVYPVLFLYDLQESRNMQNVGIAQEQDLVVLAELSDQINALLRYRTQHGIPALIDLLILQCWIDVPAQFIPESACFQ